MFYFLRILERKWTFLENMRHLFVIQNFGKIYIWLILKLEFLNQNNVFIKTSQNWKVQKCAYDCQTNLTVARQTLVIVHRLCHLCVLCACTSREERQFHLFIRNQIGVLSKIEVTVLQEECIASIVLKDNSA